MLLKETGFTFGGRHSLYDMGLDYAEKNCGHPVTPRIRRNAYQIAGASGTVLLPGESRDSLIFEGILYPAKEWDTQAQAQAQLRAAAAWLTQGRRSLIFDYEPQVYYLAEVSQGTAWSLKNWFGGEISVLFEAQPFAYNICTDTAGADTAATQTDLTLRVDTVAPAPLTLTVENRGSADITAVRAGGGKIAFDKPGFALQSGQKLIISMEAPAGAEKQTAAGFVNALPWASAFGPMDMAAGENALRIELTYGSGTKNARIEASARGRR